jgi:hypothetical protein
VAAFERVEEDSVAFLVLLESSTNRSSSLGAPR